MASHQPEDMQDEHGGDQFIKDEDVLAVVPDDGDHPMDDDEDDEASDMVGDLTHHTEGIEDTYLRQFSNHLGSVFCVSSHPIAPIVVSGGEDDLGYIWNVDDGERIVTLTGHADSITAASFSTDGEMVATGGMDGKVRVWRRVGQENWRTWEFLTELQGPDEVVWFRWHPKGNILLAGSNDATVWLWQLPSGNVMQVFVGHTAPVHCGEFTPDGKRIVTACGDNNLIYWDPRSTTPIFKLTAENARFDVDGITSLAVNPSSTLVVVGGADGGVRVVSLSKGEVVGTLNGHTKGESVEAVKFIEIGSQTDALGAVVVTGGTDGKLCVWDINTMRLRTTHTHTDAVTAVLVHPAAKAHLVTSASADTTLRTWDARTGALVREHKGHQGAILGATLGIGGSVIISAGDDGVCLVFDSEGEETT